MNDHEAKIEAIARCYEEQALGYHEIPGLRGRELHDEVRRLAAQHNMSSAQVDAGERRARRRLAQLGIMI